jgi:hypothetical protein
MSYDEREYIMKNPIRRSKNISKKNRKKLNKIDKKEDASLGGSNVVTTKHFRSKQKMGAASKVKVYTKEEIDAYEVMMKENR